jgi:hypothetical protein
MSVLKSDQSMEWQRGQKEKIIYRTGYSKPTDANGRKLREK